MILIVTGGRDFNDVAYLWRCLDEIDGGGGIVCVVEGASDDVTGPYVGADYWAHQWALARGRATDRRHADWKKHGRAAGPIRNGSMLDDYPKATLAVFNGGRGTADCARQAMKRGMKIIDLMTSPT